MESGHLISKKKLIPKWVSGKVRAETREHCNRCGLFMGSAGSCAKCKEYIREWKRENPDKVKHYKRHSSFFKGKKRALLMESLLSKQCGKCNMCGCSDGKWTIDHKIPTILGGCDEEFNLQVLCAFCNMSKGSKIIDTRKNENQLRICP